MNLEYLERTSRRTVSLLGMNINAPQGKLKQCALSAHESEGRHELALTIELHCRHCCFVWYISGLELHNKTQR